MNASKRRSRVNTESPFSRIESGTAAITVIGQGYVGLPLALAFSRAGFTVTGLDTNPAKVESLNRGRSPIEDVSDEILGHEIENARYRATTDYSALTRSDAVFICVPTPLRKTKDPDISYVMAAATEVAAHLQAGQLVVLESTTYPGTTMEVLLPLLAESGGTVGEDFFLAFSSERIDPANGTYGVGDIPKVVGGVTGNCSRIAAMLYGRIVPSVLEVSSPTVAEMSKLYENVFRNVNIALANELSMMCRRLGVETQEVIQAAATKPFGFMEFHPGPGVGGHCIAIDPTYLAWKMRLNDYDARFIHLAEEINRSMPAQVVDIIADALNGGQRSISGSTILALGVAYKRGVGDIRESPALEVMRLLKKKGAVVSYSDPYVEEVTLDDSRLVSVAINDALLRATDCVVILTDHEGFDYGHITNMVPLVVDTRNATYGIRNSTATLVRL